MTAESGMAVGETAQAKGPDEPQAIRKHTSVNPGQGKRAAFLIIPTLLLLGVVIVYPIISAIVLSFTKDPGLDKATGVFVSGGSAGFSNYTLFFTVVSVAIEVVLGMWFALIMNRNFKGRAILRAAVLIPWAIPTAVTAKLFYFIFAYDGIANTLFHTHILWTGDAWPARFAVIIADVWKTTPFMALLILAGLQVIPSEVYEAGSIDGASKWQQFRLITLPLVKTALMVAVLFRTLDVLRIFDLPWILTGGGGGNGHATTSLSILVINQLRTGTHSAAALSTITFLIIFLVAFIFVRFLGANVASNPNPKKKKKAKEEDLVEAEAI
jgi:ABC-type sugar transport system permease subunit